MESIKTVVQKLNAKALGGAKIPHGISNPVLRKSEGRVFISAFVYIYGRENLQNNKMPRPVHWMLADIETGDLVKDWDCRENDFSRASFDEVYDLNDPLVKKPTRADFEEIYSLIDSVREKYVTQGVFDEKMYAEYLDRILEVTPSNYRRFYRELSALA